MGRTTGVVQTSSGRCCAGGVIAVDGAAADRIFNRSMIEKAFCGAGVQIGVSIDSATKQMMQNGKGDGPKQFRQIHERTANPNNSFDHVL